MDLGKKMSIELLGRGAVLGVSILIKILLPINCISKIPNTMSIKNALAYLVEIEENSC